VSAAAFALALSLLAAEPLKLASPGFSGVDITDAQATFFSDHFAQQLTLRGLQVTTSSQIGALIGFERQRQLLSCKEANGSCMAELAAALGVDGVITGSVGKFDQTYQVNVSVVSAKDGRTLSAFSRKVNGSSAVLDALNDAAEQMSRELSRAFAKPSAPAPSPSKEIVLNPPPARQPVTLEPTPAPAADGLPLHMKDWFWLSGGLGLLAGGGSAYFFVQAKSAADKLQAGAADPANNHMSLAEANAVRANGMMGQTLGITLGAMAGIGLGVGAYCFFAGDSPPALSVRIVPGSTSVVVSGHFR